MDKLASCSTVFDTRSRKWVVLFDKIQTEGSSGDTFWIASNDDDDALVIVRERDLSHDDNTQEEEPWTYWQCPICGKPIKLKGYVFDDDFVEQW